MSSTSLPQSGRARRPDLVLLASEDVGQVNEDAADGTLVSLAEAKGYLNLDHDEDDTLVSALIHAGEAHVESVLHKDLKARTYTALFRYDPRHVFVQLFLTDRPASAVTAVSMWDKDGDEITLSAESTPADYAVRRWSLGVKAVAVSEQTLKTYGAGNRTGELMSFSYTTDTATSANLHGYHAIKRAVLHAVAGGYEARESEVAGPSISENPAVERLLRPFMRPVGGVLR